MMRALRTCLAGGLALAATTLPLAVAAQDEQPTDEPATALRVTLDRALGEHAFLLADVVRIGVAGGPDFDAAAAALEANSDEIIAAIEGVYGADAGDEFGELWQDHVAYIVDYSRAVAAGDADAAELASQQLDRYVADFSAFLAGAMPALPPETVEGLIGEHVQQLEHVSSFEESDFHNAYVAVRETYAHMFEVGDGLAVGIVTLYPDRYPGRYEAFGPAVELRVTLDRQLGEHTYLSALAMRAVLRDAADAASAAEALGANTADLAATIGEVYGDEAAGAFGDLWDRHVGAYVDYVTALAANDEAAAGAALDELEAYRTDFSAYVASANPFLSGPAFEALIGDHTEHLIAQADAYDAGDHGLAYELGREAYAHSAELGRSLAGAIADQFPRLFPDTAVAPAAAPGVGTPWGLVAGAVLTLAAAGVSLRFAARRPA
jgi:hypothetical protein